MNWPDTGEGGRISRHHTAGESDPAHFFVNRFCGGASVDDFVNIGRQHILEMTVKAAHCPLSAQPSEKLMHKIHRLTDN
jgi:hypothetical protein